ncbi:MAG: EFR1 family ferrodoxin [Clostridia bacterium]|nr:EFR1 family ferrodoxin [Clostridia bacterium]
MILYFSATGNSRYVAERLARSLNDQAVSIESGHRNFTLSDGEIFGIVTPVYWWQLPSIMRKYLNSITVCNAKYTFIVITYGTTTGCCTEETIKIFRRKGISLSASFSVRMPDNFTPIFDLSDPVKVETELLSAQAQTDELISRVRAHEEGYFAQPKTPYAVKLVMKPLSRHEQKTSHFIVENSCIGCGKCANNCPVNAIEIRNSKPVWTKTRCALCLRCLHSCPKFAIQYNQGFSKKHGQYLHP